MLNIKTLWLLVVNNHYKDSVTVTWHRSEINPCILACKHVLDVLLLEQSYRKSITVGVNVYRVYFILLLCLIFISFIDYEIFSTIYSNTF